MSVVIRGRLKKKKNKGKNNMHSNAKKKKTLAILMNFAVVFSSRRLKIKRVVCRYFYFFANYVIARNLNHR